jgi:phospholipid/cholesterol/gamma-HCH transport system substrate-binding protein
MRWLSRGITVAVVVIVVAGAALLIRSSVPDLTVGQHFHSYAMFRDAARLQIGSPVVIAGVRVGDISGLTIVGSSARVDLLLRDDIRIPIDSFATRRTDTLFGDSYIVIILGDDPALLKDGDPIQHVEEGGSTDTVLRAIGRTLPKIDNAMENAHDFIGDARKYVTGPFQDRLVAADKWVQEGNIDRPLARANDAMGRFESATTSAADAVADAKPTIDKRLRQVDEAVAKAKTRMREVKQGIVDGFANARTGMDRIDPVVDDMAEVVVAIDKGKGDDYRGTLGKLVNDPELAGDIETTTEAIGAGAASFNMFTKSWLGMRAEGNIFSRNVRIYASAELRSRNDKFYLIELEKSDLGGLPKDSLSDAAGTTQYTRRQSIRDTLRFTAQFGKQIGMLQLRGGIKDSTFGVGADFLMMDGRLRISADVFGAYFPTPRLKMMASYAIMRNVYILGGVDDALNAPGVLRIQTGNSDVPHFFDEVRFGRDYFIGGALHFDDQDLALLLRIYGAMIVGLL